MGHILFWLEATITSVLLVALVVSLLARTVDRLWRRRLAMGILVLLPLPWIAAIAIFAFLHLRVGGAGFALLGSCIGGALFVIGAGTAAGYGLRRSRDDPQRRRAAEWRPSRVALAFAAGLLLTCMTFWNLDLAVRQEMAVLRTKAGAMALSVAPARIPNSRNAALLYRQAWELLEARQAEGRRWREMVGAWAAPTSRPFDPDNERMVAFLERQAPVIRLLREAARRPGCNFGSAYNPPSPELVLPQLGKMRALSQLLYLSACVNASRGRTGEALEDVNACFALAGHCTADPVLIASLVAFAAEKEAFAALQYVLSRSRPSGEDLERLKLDPFLSFNDTLRRSMRMEEAWGLSIFTMWDPVAALEGLTGRRGFRLGPAVYRVFLWLEDVRAYRRWMQKYHQLSARPYYQSRDGWERMSGGQRDRLGGLLASQFTPSLFRCAEHAAEADARHRLALIAVAMWRHRLCHQSLPDRLDHLVPQYLLAVPMDPFTGKGMKLARKGDGKVVIYSLGADLADDGGRPWDRKARKGDIVLVLTQ